MFDTKHPCVFNIATLLEQLHRDLLNGYEKVRPSIHGEPVTVDLGIAPTFLLSLVRHGLNQHTM